MDRLLYLASVAKIPTSRFSMRLTTMTESRLSAVILVRVHQKNSSTSLA